MIETLILFFKVLGTEFIAEMGDKTQLMLIALTSKYKIRDIILGTAIAILILNGFAVLAGGLLGDFLPVWLIKTIAAFAFMYFAATSLMKEDDEDEEIKENKFQFAPLSVAATFFVAELGDKTQLTAITFGANEGLNNAIVVWIGCSIGLFAADIIGMMIGYLLQSKMPEGFLNSLAFIIFAVFGVMNIGTALKLAPFISSGLVLPLQAGITVIFAGICIYIYLKNRKAVK